MSAARLRDLLLGLVALSLIVAGLGVAYLKYARVLTSSETITLQTDVVGNALQKGSDVKFQGVPIGYVDAIRATDAGAELTLALSPETLAVVPENVVARLLPKTMFGERYVALVAPEATGASSQTISAGAVITQDDSAEAAELQQVFDEMLPVLRAIQPEKLSAMLSEFATMLQGNGADLGDSMVAWSDYVKKMNPKVPQMAEDFRRLASVADSWSIAAPDLVDALATMTTSSKLLVDEKANLAQMYAGVTGSAQTAGAWVGDNHDTIDILTEESAAALRASSPYASQFPCLFEAVAGMKPRMDKALGKGTDQPGMHAVVQVMPAREKYLAGKDDIKLTKRDPGPRCPYVSGTVGTRKARAAVGRTDRTGHAREKTAGSGTAWPSGETTTAAGNRTGDTAGDEPPMIAPPPAATGQSYLSALVGLGEANSPGENQLIAEVLAPSQGMAPIDYPGWNSLLLGPTLRNTKVVLK